MPEDVDSELDQWVYRRPSEWTEQQREHVKKCIVGPGWCPAHAIGEQKMDTADSHSGAGHMLIGKPVALTVTTSRDTFYGTLVGADADFVTLRDLRYGWHGGSGWWHHGTAEMRTFPTATVRWIDLDNGSAETAESDPTASAPEHTDV